MFASTGPAAETTAEPPSAPTSLFTTPAPTTSSPTPVSSTSPDATDPPTTAATTSTIATTPAPATVPGADQLTGEADPAELAEIEAHRELWESMRPTEYTMAIQRVVEGEGPLVNLRQSAPTTPLRVIVVEGRLVEVIGLYSGCVLSGDDSVPTVEGLFDLAAAAATASNHSMVLDERWGYVEMVGAFDGTFSASGGVRWLVPTVAPAQVDAAVGPALDLGRRTWDANRPSDYVFGLRVDGGISGGTYRVVVADRQNAGIERSDGQTFDEALATEVPGTIEEVFDVVTGHLGRDPDYVIAGVHPDLGYPTDATFDHIRDADDDEYRDRGHLLRIHLTTYARVRDHEISLPSGDIDRPREHDTSLTRSLTH